MDGLVLKPGIGDKKLVFQAEIKQSLTIAISVTHAMWTNDRLAGLSYAREKYGREFFTLIRGFVVTSRRIITQRQHLAFNSRCKRYRLIPKFL